ncbi:hypothetical protein DFAR_2530007 [Desulfarculales bacterium]
MPDQGLILLRSPRQLIEPEQFRLILAHELTHLYLAAALRHREHLLWLEEGLAMYASGEGGWERAAVSQDSEQASLAYAQSAYMVFYLLNHHG